MDRRNASRLTTGWSPRCRATQVSLPAAGSPDITVTVKGGVVIGRIPRIAAASTIDRS